MRSARWVAALAGLLFLAGCTAAAPDPAPSPSPSGQDLNAELVRIEVTTPIGLAAAGGNLWVASANGNDIVGINPSNLRRAKSVNVGLSPLRLAVSAHVVFVSSFRSGQVEGIDTGSGANVGTFAMPGGPEGLAADLDYLWIVRQDAGVVTQLQHGKSQGRDIPVPGTPRLVDSSGAYAYVTSYATGTVTRIAKFGDEVVTSEKICDGAQGVQALHEVVWITCTRADEVVAVDQKTLKVLGRVKVAGQPDGIRIASDRIFVAAAQGPTLYEISNEPTAPKILLTRELGTAPALNDRANVDVAFFAGRVWVSSYSEDAVYGLKLARR